MALSDHAPATLPPQLSDNDHDDDKQCAICLEPFTLTTDNDDDDDDNHTATAATNKIRARCGHVLHGPCLRASIRSGNYTCPLCRLPLGEPGEAGGTAATEHDRATAKAFRRYETMLRVAKVPEAAVRQRMAADGVSPADVDAFFTGGLSRQDGVRDDALEAAAAAAASGAPDAKRLEAYAAMIKRGLPEAAVRQKMVLDKVPAAAVEEFFQHLPERLA